jgi:crotonobetainyl-CoA:carnitine CoA-transferase CaiB-like acyl-CoA transferase
MTTVPHALEGVKVVEFGGYAAGPHIGKMLGNFGAIVVHVESHNRPDGFRLEYPPFKEGKAGVNRSGCFSFFNDSKYGVTVDVKRPEGLELARRLTDWADVVIENMRPGVMARVGLAYDELSKTNPGLIMLSTCNMGQTGPRALTPGFGSQLSSLAGFCGAIGESDGPPMLLYGPYIDFVASVMGCSAALAALDRGRRSGKGAWIDIAQYECGLHFMAGAIFAYHQDGIIAGRSGNADIEAAPHGAYQCRDGRWLALSCWSDAEFKALAEALDCPSVAEDPRFADIESRRNNAQALDEAVARSLSECDAEKTAEALQRVGVGAYPVNTVADLFSDPQLDERRTWRRHHHEEIGEQAYLMPGFDLSSTPGDISQAAPVLGGDNEVVFRDFLGLSEDEFDAYAEKGAFN